MTEKAMARNIYLGEVSRNEEVRPDFFLMKIRLPAQFERPLPGQFVMVRVAGLQDPFLSRPLSIYACKQGPRFCTIELLYRVAGKGTRILAGLIPGSQVELSGPLGTGYRVDRTKKNIVLIAGGIGIAPLSLLVRELRRRSCRAADAMTVYLGARTETALVGLDALRQSCSRIIVCTDDGTLGEKAPVTKAFQRDLPKFNPADTALYACGPKPMICSLAGLLNDQYFCQVSLEERMACGVGACAGCVVAVKDASGNKAYRRVCADGPVFELKDILWE